MPRKYLSLIFCFMLSAGSFHFCDSLQAETEKSRWWKGGLHSHSLWSDGDDFPEMITDWYLQNGYHFLSFSEHDRLQEGEFWIPASRLRRNASVLEKYIQRFGKDWVEKVQDEKETWIRLKPLADYRHLFEKENEFLLINGIELTGTSKVHLNAVNVQAPIYPLHYKGIRSRIAMSSLQILKQAERTGKTILPVLNHPNLLGIRAEEMARSPALLFFEIYNGNGLAQNSGFDQHPDTDQLWDRVLLLRIVGFKKLTPFYGIATDDAHNYHPSEFYPKDDALARPGLAWVMVRAPQLESEALMQAMMRGDFYASTGVSLEDIQWDGKTLSLKIQPEPDVVYHTRFIGTRAGSRNAGEILSEQTGTEPSYTLQGNEFYVRAKIISSREMKDAFLPGEKEIAWTQPFVPEKIPVPQKAIQELSEEMSEKDEPQRLEPVAEFN